MIGLKYWFEFTNIENDVFRCEILEKDFEGEDIEIHGNVRHAYAERKDLFQAVIASSLDIGLEADETLTLQDLYSESEQQFTVKLFRNSHIIFHGFLKPDGIWEDWVNDKWELSVDAMDGLSIIKDLSFVKDNGTFYQGKITQFEAIKICLHRIGYDLPINISSDLPVYDGFLSDDSILHNVQMNTERFYQDAKKNNIMDCERVLKDVLEPYNATVIQMNGEWWIFRAIDVKDEMTFLRYDLENVRTTVIWNASLTIGSHIDEFEIHHVNANQKKSCNASTQAFRVNYKYGTVRSIVDNSYLEHNGTTIAGWIFNPPYVYLNPSGRGIIVRNNDDMSIIPLQLNQSVAVKANDIVNFNVNMYLYLESTIIPQFAFIIFLISTDNYYLIEGLGWVLKTDHAEEKSGVVQINKEFDGDITWSADTPHIPEDSNIYFKIATTFEVASGNEYSLYINSIDVTPSQGNYKGEFHTAQRSTRISSVTKNDKTVSVGDSVSDIYLGTLYKLSGDPTTVWHRIGQTETLPLLRIMVEDSLRIAPRPMLFFEGDTYGYYPYLTNVLINNISGKFQPSKYNYDCQRNINRANFKEFATDYLLPGDFRYEFEYDYGQETKVNIIA